MDLKELASWLRNLDVRLLDSRQSAGRSEPVLVADELERAEREIEARVASRMLGALEELCLGRFDGAPPAFWRAVKAKFESLHDWSLLDRARGERAEAERREWLTRKALALAVRALPDCGHGVRALPDGKIEGVLVAGCPRCGGLKALFPEGAPR